MIKAITYLLLLFSLFIACHDHKKEPKHNKIIYTDYDSKIKELGIGAQIDSAKFILYTFFCNAYISNSESRHALIQQSLVISELKIAEDNSIDVGFKFDVLVDTNSLLLRDETILQKYFPLTQSIKINKNKLYFLLPNNTITDLQYEYKQDHYNSIEKWLLDDETIYYFQLNQNHINKWFHDELLKRNVFNRELDRTRFPKQNASWAYCLSLCFPTSTFEK